MDYGQNLLFVQPDLLTDNPCIFLPRIRNPNLTITLLLKKKNCMQHSHAVYYIPLYEKTTEHTMFVFFKFCLCSSECFIFVCVCKLHILWKCTTPNYSEKLSYLVFKRNQGKPAKYVSTSNPA